MTVLEICPISQNAMAGFMPAIHVLLLLDRPGDDREG
jgi:hypothetical protein